MSFIAIDFETANNNYNSACSIGLVVVNEKEIVETKYFLIQPPTLDFDTVNINIHGLTPDDVTDSPKFPEIWEQIKHYFSNTMVVALKPKIYFKNPAYNSFNTVKISEIAATHSYFDKNHVFYGKILVFTGNLETLERAEAMQQIIDKGGILKNSVVLKTDYLVVGVQNKSLVGESGLSGKEIRAYELIEKGRDITILAEDEFIKLLNN